jgi:predicted adenine nucleotide alpha hydrolase (AANH) superfamily ATPase
MTSGSRKILLHTCCAPCTTYVYDQLRDKFEVKGLFYNPNIQPQAEYERRLLTMEHYATGVGLKVIYDTPSVPSGHLPLNKGEKERGLEPEDCENCYRVRLLKTAQYAARLGFDCFSTTLLISPYQKHDLLKQAGEKIALEIGVEFYYNDFRSGFTESRRMSKAMHLYMQKYCGCREVVHA